MVELHYWHFSTFGGNPLKGAYMNKGLFVVPTDLEAALRDAIDAFIDGRTAYLYEIQHREVLARSRRNLWKIIEGGRTRCGPRLRLH
jgi:hypothetical protein